MPWEAYLKVLKPKFRRSNWKSAPYTVMKDWATKSVMHYRDPSRASWHNNEVEPSSEYYLDLELLAKTSDLVRLLLQLEAERPVSVRYLKSVTRGRDEVRVHDYVLLHDAQPGQPARVAQIAQMVQVQIRGSMSAVIRMWCPHAREVQTAEDETLVTCAPPVGMIVRFESMHVVVVTRCGTRDGCEQYI